MAYQLVVDRENKTINGVDFSGTDDFEGACNVLGSITKSLPFQVEVSRADDVWIADCDELGLVTEADSYEELIDRVCTVAGDMYTENGFIGDVNDLRLSFVYVQNIPCGIAE